MRNLLSLLILTAILASCTPSQKFGSKISPKGAIAATEVQTQLADADSMFMKVSGPVTAVCKKKGCWMNMDMGNDQTMLVRFKDYGFFVPLDCEGATATVEGWAYRRQISVEELRHYAEDAGKSKDEIMAITQPKDQISFYADGVILTDMK